MRRARYAEAMSALRPPLLLLCLVLIPAPAPANQPAQDPADAPLIRIDKDKRQVRVRCQALRVEMPLEFFCVLRGTADHETVLRTLAKPSAVHAALLGLGLEPGHPLRFVPERKQWIAPAGPPVRIDVEWEQDGKTVRRRAGELMRNMKTGEVMPPHHWVFVGSALGPNGEYGADVTGQLVSIVNFEFTTIDVPRVASNANETLEWEINPDTMPPAGAEVWMVITPIEGAATQPATKIADAEPREVEAPAEVVVVMLDQAGGVMVNNEPVALAEVGQAVRARLPSGAVPPSASVRLTAPRGASVDVLGRLLAELVRAEITDVIFVPPPPLAAARETPAAETDGAAKATTVEVHDGGREVTIGGKRQPIGQLVQSLREASPSAPNGQKQATYVIKAAADATDLKPVDFAAIHAALYVLGQDVKVDAPGYGPATGPAAGATGAAGDAKLAELRRRWEEQVLPQSASIQRAAATHYEVMEAYQQEINRLLDEVERLRQEMDSLQQRYNDLTTPNPAPNRD